MCVSRACVCGCRTLRVALRRSHAPQGAGVTRRVRVRLRVRFRFRVWVKVRVRVRVRFRVRALNDGYLVLELTWPSTLHAERQDGFAQTGDC